jgi:hypothetical protein
MFKIAVLNAAVSGKVQTMHILVVHQYFLGQNDAGGSRWNQFAKYWAQAGHTITVLAGTVHYATGEKQARYKGRFLVTEYDGPNIVVKRCHVSETYNKSTFGRAWAYCSFAFSSTLAGLFVKKSDVIICTSPALIVGLTGAILSWFKGVPMVVYLWFLRFATSGLNLSSTLAP